MNETPSPDYQAYLLRLWRETTDLPWRATLEDPHTGRRQGFADLSQLIAFFQQLDEILRHEAADEN